MDAIHNPPAFMIPHQVQELLLDMDPEGAYSISYDIFTRKTKEDLPAGWNSYRGVTYLEIARILGVAGFHHKQYSDWVSDESDALHVFWTMLDLTLIRPLGKLESTVKGLKAHHIPNWELDITEDIQLGGFYSPNLHGLTPTGLVPLNVPSVIPDSDMYLPDFMSESPNALDLANWRI